MRIYKTLPNTKAFLRVRAVYNGGGRSGQSLTRAVAFCGIGRAVRFSLTFTLN